MGRVVLEARNLTKRFGGLVALKRVNISVSDGEIYGIIGPNGSGKTTLFNVITGILRQDEGEIIFMGKDISRLPPHARARIGIARTFQNIRVYPHLPVYYNVAVAALAKYGDRGEAHREALRVLNLMKLLGDAWRPAGSLTPYKLKLTEFARALVLKPKVMLLDEPFAGLTPGESGMLIDVIRDLNENGMTFVIIEHKLRYLMRIASRVAVLCFGEKIFEGKPEDAVRDKRVIEAYIGGGLG